MPRLNNEYDFETAESIRPGDLVYDEFTGFVYIISHVSATLYKLIALNDGNRLSDEPRYLDNLADYIRKDKDLHHMPDAMVTVGKIT